MKPTSNGRDSSPPSVGCFFLSFFSFFTCFCGLSFPIATDLTPSTTDLIASEVFSAIDSLRCALDVWRSRSSRSSWNDCSSPASKRYRENP